MEPEPFVRGSGGVESKVAYANSRIFEAEAIEQATENIRESLMACKLRQLTRL